MRRHRRRTKRQGPGTTDRLGAFIDVMDREWARLANPGTWWTGDQRVAIGAEARAAALGKRGSTALADAPAEASRRVATEASTIRPVDIERWADQGLDAFSYVEIVGIVSRLTALDTAAFGLGLDERPLPEPRPGNPTRRRPDNAVTTNGWVPTVGPASAPSSLSAVTAESEAMFDLHGVLYATIAQMSDLGLKRDGLHRSQMELVAARTSRLNDCFY